MAVVKITHCSYLLQSFHTAALSSEAAPYILSHNLMLMFFVFVITIHCGSSEVQQLCILYSDIS